MQYYTLCSIHTIPKVKIKLRSGSAQLLQTLLKSVRAEGSPIAAQKGIDRG